jgi:hypothetical protein
VHGGGQPIEHLLSRQVFVLHGHGVFEVEHHAIGTAAQPFFEALRGVTGCE